MRVTRSGEQYLGEALEYPVMTHGRTLEELAENMEKALAMFLAENETEDEDEMLVAVKVEIN